MPHRTPRKQQHQASLGLSTGHLRNPGEIFSDVYASKYVNKFQVKLFGDTMFYNFVVYYHTNI